MNQKKPHVLLEKRVVFLDREDCFHVKLFHMNQDCFCIIDVYPTKDPRHPSRHPGWFRFDIEGDGVYGFRMLQEQGKCVIKSTDGIPVSESWQAEEKCLEMLPLSIRVVLRSKKNNAILYEDRLICYGSSQEHEIQEKEFFSLKDSIREVPLVQQILPSALQVKLVLRSLSQAQAAGCYVWEAWSLLQKAGIDSKIYVQTCEDWARPFVHSIQELLQKKDDVNENTVLLYNYVDRDDWIEEIVRIPCKKVAYFHGMPNPDRFRVFDAKRAERYREAWNGLHVLVNFDKILVNSFVTSRRMLCAMDEASRSIIEERLSVMPPMLLSDLIWDKAEVDGNFQKNVEGFGDVLFYMGGVQPHKRIEDILQVFRSLSEENKNAALLVVGNAHESYRKYLQFRIGQMTEAQQKRIHIFPMMSRSQIKAAYRASKAFLTMSEDDGFCVPIWHAMREHLPVLAKVGTDTAAPELLDGTGKLICGKNYEDVGHEIHRIFQEPEYCKRIVEEQDKKLNHYQDKELSRQFLEMIAACWYM